MAPHKPALRKNLKRLLAPRHIAFIGGNDADYSARQCAAVFDGPVWGVNPKRSEMGGQPCYSSVADLPQAPDAVFLATPRDATLQVLQELDQAGAGGVACFTAGYGELGEEGKQSEAELVAAAGKLALVGPNSYGLIDYIHKSYLWPFGAGSCDCEKGVALIMQSGMITADMVMNQRSVPLCYVISAGNQAVLAIEDYIDVLVDDPRIAAFGLYIEGIVDVEWFAAVSIRALEAGKPIVVLKAGSSAIGSQLAVSHTGSLSGADEAHQALFDELGIIRVYSPELLLETLKFTATSGIPTGRKLAAFTCSGGEALMIADYCERTDLELSPYSQSSVEKLENLLPDIATVSNPLDYTTPLWGNTEVMPKVFDAALEDGFDAAIFIQDYPPEEFDADRSFYRADAMSYIGAVNRAGIPAGICSELAENFDRESREMMIAGGVSPLQGFDRGLDAISLACEYHMNRERIRGDPTKKPFRVVKNFVPGNPEPGVARLLDEWECKQLLADYGLGIPPGRLVTVGDTREGVQVAEEISYQLVSAEVAHKSELGVVALGLDRSDQLKRAMAEISSAVEDNNIRGVKGILVEAMVVGAVHELLVGVQRDPQFGLVMVIASGGVLVELYRDSTTILLPTTAKTVGHAISTLKCFPLLQGYRGKPGCDLDAIVGDILKIAEFAESQACTLAEMDVNPLIILPGGAMVADALVRVSS
jgi:acyl-CoA synthetase (NDP forming)